MSRGSGLQAAAAAVVDTHDAEPSPEALLAREDAIERLRVAVAAERERGKARVARMRARRKESTDAGSEG